MFNIRSVKSGKDLEEIIDLFTSYANSLDVSLDYQDFSSELEEMPGKYALPHGALLLAYDKNDNPVGCIALRPLDQEYCCEMKRLYVSPSGRGFGLGKALVEAILQEARNRGYREIRLDTLPSMLEAIALYKKMGFKEIRSYYDTPIEGTVFLAKSLG